MVREKMYDSERVIKKCISDGRFHLRKEYENTRRKSVIIPYKQDFWFYVVSNLHEINKETLSQDIPFTVETTFIRGEIRYKYV